MKSALTKRVVLVTVPVAAILIAVLFRQQGTPAKSSAAAGKEPAAGSMPGHHPISPEETSQIAMIMGTQIPQEDRIKFVRELPGSLSPALSRRLFDLLGAPKNQDDRSWFLICNEIMEVLRTRSLGEGTYSRGALALIQNQAADPVIRDYASQHLIQWIAGINPEQRENDKEIIATVFDHLCAEIKRPQNAGLTLLGTTLQALADAATNGDDAMKTRKAAIAELAVETAKDDSARMSVINRSSAIQTAARLDAPGITELSRTYALDPTSPIEIRLSSVAALGLTGDQADIAALDRISRDKRLRYPAEAAIARLKTRNANQFSN